MIREAINAKMLSDVRILANINRKDITMSQLREQLEIEVCPHCGRANPTLNLVSTFLSTDSNSRNNPLWWGFYLCKSCGNIVTACAYRVDSNPARAQIGSIYPSIPIISDSIPEKPRELLQQAQNSLHAPAGAIMLCASAVDAMLKLKGYKIGTLNERIDKAAEDHLITDEMSKWAHQVRLDANDQRHADEKAPMPTRKDAAVVVDFAKAFAEYLFVLPSMVTRGISESKPKS